MFRHSSLANIWPNKNKKGQKSNQAWQTLQFWLTLCRTVQIWLSKNPTRYIKKKTSQKKFAIYSYQNKKHVQTLQFWLTFCRKKILYKKNHQRRGVTPRQNSNSLLITGLPKK